MPDSDRELTEPLRPATFRRRGAAVPFTSPLLAGARVRLSVNTEPELVLPRTSGGSGVYVLQWRAVRSVCNPTVHDTMLFRRITGVCALDPVGIRDAALHVALAGHAGRQAMEAASVAIQADQAQRLRASFQLRTNLLRQMQPAGQPTAGSGVDFEQRANGATLRLAASLRRPAAELSAALGSIIDAFAPVGVAADDRLSRIARLLIRLRDTHTQLAGWAAANADDELGLVGGTLAAAMDSITQSGLALLFTTRDLLGDVVTMLRRFGAEPQTVLQLAQRCDWLLDGWERVCLLWAVATTNSSRRVAVLEMAQLVPELPEESSAWTAASLSPDAVDAACRVISQHDGWRNGANVFGLVERNEKLRVMSA